VILVSALVLSVFAVPALYADNIITISIDISPSTLNTAYQGQVVTVHTDISYEIVAGATVKLNDIDIAWWKADDRGNFVAKFNAQDVIGIVEPGMATLTLTGDTIEGTFFSGTSTFKVICVTGRN
jgi:hypothetical protein